MFEGADHSSRHHLPTSLIFGPQRCRDWCGNVVFCQYARRLQLCCRERGAKPAKKQKKAQKHTLLAANSMADALFNTTQRFSSARITDMV